MSVSLICAPHSPIMHCYAREPDDYNDIERVFDERAAAVKEFDPELVVILGSDHFNGFFLNLMPAFCVGFAANAVGDIGGFKGTLNVPDGIALDCVNHLRKEGVDTAVSYEMTVDHAFTQTLHRILGGLDCFPVLPVFINCITPPFVPFKRTRILGETIGHYIKSLGKRVLILASGGLSHNPTRYYPAYGTGGEQVTSYQMYGGVGSKGLRKEEWLERLDVMHREGAEMLIDGRRTKEDIKLNPEIDHLFMDIITSGDIQKFDEWEAEWLIEKAGIGAMEQQTWIAAAAANKAAGGSVPQVGIYSETLEYGIAFGLMHAG